MANFNVKLLEITVFVLIICSPLISRSQSIALPNAFAHNDYRHIRPLTDALENGFTNIEADVFLKDESLIIAHVNPFFKHRRTLEALYLEPLKERITANNGQVYKGYDHPVILMIDIKTGANNTYSALMPVLEQYKSILTRYDHGKIYPGPVTIVLSGHKPNKMIKNEQSRYAFIDEDLRKTFKDTTVKDVYTMSSCKYSKLLKWKGTDSIPSAEYNKLCNFVTMAHKLGEKVRLWASPENSAVWEELLKCHVDLINTDKLVVLKDFLISRNISIATRTSVAPVNGQQIN